MFDKIKASIKTAQDKAKAMGKSATASMKKQARVPRTWARRVQMQSKNSTLLANKPVDTLQN